MPKRQTYARIDMSAAQGEGAYVELSRATYADRTQLLKAIADADGDADAERVILDNLAKRIVAWNLVDETGAALPLPETAADLLGGMLDSELDELTRQGYAVLLGNRFAAGDAEKN